MLVASISEYPLTHPPHSVLLVVQVSHGLRQDSQTIDCSFLYSEEQLVTQLWSNRNYALLEHYTHPVMLHVLHFDGQVSQWLRELVNDDDPQVGTHVEAFNAYGGLHDEQLEGSEHRVHGHWQGMQWGVDWLVDWYVPSGHVVRHSWLYMYLPATQLSQYMAELEHCLHGSRHVSQL